MTTLAVIALCRRARCTLQEIETLLATGGGASWKALATKVGAGEAP